MKKQAIKPKRPVHKQRYSKPSGQSGLSRFWINQNDILSFLNSALLFLFIFLLPTQLGKHFFFSFSYLSGVRIDYLAPTIYITDILVLALFLLNYKRILSFFKNKTLLFTLFLLIAGVVFAISKEIAMYRYIKIIELIIVFALFKKLKIDKKILAFGFVIASFFEFVLVVLQFVNKHSLQGIFYFFGERYLSLSTPGIAKASLQGVEFLRPYGTFSHPNSMAGFFLLLYTFVLTSTFFSPVFRKIILLLSGIIIFFSFSKIAILGFLVINLIFILKNKKNVSCLPCVLSEITIFAVLSLIFLTAKTDPTSIQKRLNLLQSSLGIISRYPVTGVGLGNYLIVENKINLRSLFPFQPVHNIFLLFFAEVGIILGGFIMFNLYKYFKNKFSSFPFLLCLTSIVITGLFDHYWWSLQQNWILMGVVFGLL